MICPMCEEEVEENARTCGKCGFKLTPKMICPMCEGEIEEGAKSCGTCGFRLTPTIRFKIRDFFRPNSEKGEEPITIWENRGRFSHRRTDIVGLLGLIIGLFFAWFILVLWIPYRYAGTRGAHIFIPLFILRVLSRTINPNVGVYLEIGTYILYILAWIRIRSIIKRFEVTIN